MDLILPLGFAAWVLISLTVGLRKYGQRSYLLAYEFPAGVVWRLRREHPRLTREQIDEVMSGLRDWFLVAQGARRRPVSMPSRIVDAAWHELILDTRAYRELCDGAFGRMFHHVPAEAMRSPTQAQEGIRRAWRIACALEHIDPRQPTRLPRLFALDALLGIEGGFTYTLDCIRDPAAAHCASAIGCASGCGGSGCGGDGGGDGGCGGGCGGD